MATRAKKSTARKRTTRSVKKAKSGSKTNKDACYYKVKSQYKVFPSAYASGAIAKCRKRRAGKKK